MSMQPNRWKLPTHGALFSYQFVLNILKKKCPKPTSRNCPPTHPSFTDKTLWTSTALPTVQTQRKNRISAFQELTLQWGLLPRAPAFVTSCLPLQSSRSDRVAVDYLKSISDKSMDRLTETMRILSKGPETWYLLRMSNSLQCYRYTNPLILVANVCYLNCSDFIRFISCKINANINRQAIFKFYSLRLSSVYHV
jgi:hypothetical protein